MASRHPSLAMAGTLSGRRRPNTAMKIDMPAAFRSSTKLAARNATDRASGPSGIDIACGMIVRPLRLAHREGQLSGHHMSVVTDGSPTQHVFPRDQLWRGN